MLPSRQALRVAAVLGLPVAGGVAVGAWLGGPAAAVGVLLGVAGGLQPAVLDVGRPTRAGLAALVPLSAWLGVTAAGHPVAAGVVVAALTLLQWPAGPRVGGALAFVPVVAALGASIGLSDAGRLALWTGVGVALIVALAAALHVKVPVTPVPEALARRHALVAAVASGLALALCLENGVTHGYWLVVTLALVLRPIPGETSSSARDRTLGTVAGAAVAIAAVLLLPTVLVGVFVLGCLLLTLAWAASQDVRRQTLWSTPVVILAGSSGVAGSSVDLAAERLLYVAAAAVLAVLLALLLHRWDAREGPAPASGG